MAQQQPGQDNGASLWRQRQEDGLNAAAEAKFSISHNMQAMAEPNEFAAGGIHQHHLNDLSRLPALRNRLRGHVDSVIRCLPCSETQAYMEARQRDFDLVMTETDPLQFVRYCDYDLLNGAKRLCAYWTERRKLFGDDRAFLPLTLTGTGALTTQDLMGLRAGFPVVLPNTTTGHCIMFTDRRKKCPNLTVDHYLRCFFYLFSVVAENDLSQVEYALAINMSVTPRSKDSHDKDLVIRLSVLCRTAIPVKLKFHILSFPKRRDLSFGAEIVENVVQLLRRYFFSWMDIQIHVETEPKKVITDLFALGLTTKSIPLFLGGEWKFEDFSAWCQNRMEWEYEKYKDRLLPMNDHDMTSNMTTFKKFKAKEVAELISSTEAQKNSDEMNSEDDPVNREQYRLTKRRLSDRLYSRQKRERQRVAFQSLKQKSSEVEEENERLKREHNRLKVLLEEAEGCVATISKRLKKQDHFL